MAPVGPVFHPEPLDQASAPPPVPSGVPSPAPVAAPSHDGHRFHIPHPHLPHPHRFERPATGVNPEYVEPVTPADFARPAATDRFGTGAGVFAAPTPKYRSAESVVLAGKRASMELNGLGQHSILIGIGLSLVLVLSYFARGLVFVGVFAGAVIGFQYGLRGYRASRRGFASNPAASIAGMAMAVVFALAQVVLLVLLARDGLVGRSAL